jgi:hypothetical protein
MDCSSFKLHYSALGSMIMMLLWASYIAAGQLHCLVAGAIANWWVINPYESHSLIVRKSFECALKNNFSAICFGSLISAIVKTIWLIVFIITTIMESMHQEKCTSIQCMWSPYVFIMKCMQSILRLLDQMFAYFNRYALSYVAIKRQTYLESSQAVLELLVKHGLTFTVNDATIDITLALIQFCVTMISLTLAIVFSKHSLSSNSMKSFFIISTATSSSLISSVVMKLISAGVATVFILYAENPIALKQNHVDQYEILHAIWMETFHLHDERKLPSYVDMEYGSHISDDEEDEGAEPLLKGKPFSLPQPYCIEYD